MLLGFIATSELLARELCSEGFRPFVTGLLPFWHLTLKCSASQENLVGGYGQVELGPDLGISINGLINLGWRDTASQS